MSQTALSVFTNSSCHRQFATDDGHSVVLEFTAKVGDVTLLGKA